MNDTVRIASVTGIDLALKVAGPGARSYAFLIDWHFRVLLALAWLLAGLAIGWAGSASFARGSAMFVFGVMTPAAAIYLLYHPVLEILMQGRTPGKRIAGVRIVMEDGRLPGAVPLLIRNVLRLLDSLPAMYVIGLTATLVTRNAVRIGDLAAGTVLVYERAGRHASAAELARDQNAFVRHGLDRAELARELIDRWPELEAEARTRLARRLLAGLGESPAEDAGEGRLMALLEAHVQR